MLRFTSKGHYLFIVGEVLRRNKVLVRRLADLYVKKLEESQNSKEDNRPAQIIAIVLCTIWFSSHTAF
jgi:hypothetical protein